MNGRRQVLVVDRAEGALSGVMDELDALGFRVVWVPTLRPALDFVKASPGLVLVVASAAAAEDGGQDFLAQIKDIRPSLRIIWGARSSAPPRPQHDYRPDSLIPEPFRSDALRHAVSSLLADAFYPKPIADAVQTAALEVLGTLGDFTVDGGAFLVANRTALFEFSSVVGFGGDASGHLLLSMSMDHVKTLYQRFLPGSPPVSMDRLEDLAGELCNRILGRINSFFAQYSLAVHPGTPLFIRAAGSTMRYPGQHPSFGVQLSAGGVRVGLEYYLAEFDKTKLEGGTSGAVMSVGEILYF